MAKKKQSRNKNRTDEERKYDRRDQRRSGNSRSEAGKPNPKGVVKVENGFGSDELEIKDILDKLLDAVESEKKEVGGGKVTEQAPKRKPEFSKVTSKFSWSIPCVKNAGISIGTANFDLKFCQFLEGFKTLFRYSLGVQPMKEFSFEEFENLKKVFRTYRLDWWPFDNPNFSASIPQLRQLFAKINEEIKLCLFVECAKRGYSYKVLKTRTIPAVYFTKIDTSVELKTFSLIVGELKKSLTERGINLAKIPGIRDCDNILEGVVPALEKFDSDALWDYGIEDSLDSIADRKKLGFEVSEQDVDDMLESSFNEKGFGEFPSTAHKAPELFTTRKQYEKIVSNMPGMFSITDIRIRTNGIKALCSILQKLSDEDKEVLASKESCKIPLSKLLGAEVPNWKASTKDKAKPLKYFFSAIGKENPGELDVITAEQFSNILLCFYSIFDVFDVNHMVFVLFHSFGQKTSIENGKFEKQYFGLNFEARKNLIEGMVSLPKTLKTRLEIGVEFFNEPIPDEMSKESIYYQIYHALSSPESDGDWMTKIKKFATAEYQDQKSFISFERIVRIVMNSIRIGKCQKAAVSTLNMMNDRRIERIQVSKELVQELILLALYKYAVPANNGRSEKYAFINSAFEICNKICKRQEMALDEEFLVGKWKELGHPWFAELYINHYFDVLKFESMTYDFPWLRKDQWKDGDGGEEKKEEISIEKYAELVKTSTSWPDCCEVDFVYSLAKKYIPANVDMYELFQVMQNKVEELEVRDNWKMMLKDNYAKFRDTVVKEQLEVKVYEKAVNGGELEVIVEGSEGNEEEEVKDTSGFGGQEVEHQEEAENAKEVEKVEHKEEEKVETKLEVEEVTETKVENEKVEHDVVTVKDSSENVISESDMTTTSGKFIKDFREHKIKEVWEELSEEEQIEVKQKRAEALRNERIQAASAKIPSV